MSPKGVLEGFKAWMKGVSIQYSDAIELVDAAQGCSGLALGVRAARDVAEGEQLCVIPKAACLSIRTTQLADVIAAEELGGGLGLVLAVLHEMSLGEESKWHGYFQSLPPREYLPLFWSDAELERLQGTALEHSVRADREAAAEDFEECVLPLPERYPGRLRPGFLTLHNFHVAASFVASRAFGVDEWHGDAMVPLADVFNHKASVVHLGGEYEVHGAQSDSEEDSGSGSGAEEEEEEEEEEEAEEESAIGSGSDEEEEGGEEEGEEEKGRGNSGCTAARGAGGGCGDPPHHRHAGDGDAEGGEAGAANGALPRIMAAPEAAIYGLSEANGLHLRLEMGIVDRDEDTLEIVAAAAVPAGREVHNTYGELGNAELVKKYGFALRHNPFTTVDLDKAALMADARARLGVARHRRRCRLLQEGSSVLEEDEEPFEAAPNGHISPALFVALRVLCAPDEEAATWRGLADALRPPSGASGKGGASERSEEEEEEVVPPLGAVQAWPVLGPDGRRLQPEAAAAGREEAGGAYAAQLSRTAWELAEAAVLRRLEAYAEPLEPDLERLAALDARQQQQQQQQGQEQQQPGPKSRGGKHEGPVAAAAAAAALSEGEAAECAALLLRVTEKEVLADLLAALRLRLASLPAEQAGSKDGRQAGSGAAATSKARQGKRAAAAAASSGQRGGGAKRRPAGR